MDVERSQKDVWASGDSYEPYVGRWSRLVAQEFLDWLKVPPHSRWLDVGCGTGALTRTILEISHPQKIKGIDRSPGFVLYSRRKITDPRAEFVVGDAQALPVDADRFDAAVSALVLNFVPQPEKMIAEMKRAVRKNGAVAGYVWDYAGNAQFLRHFWDAAVALDHAAQDLDEGRRFPGCNPGALDDLFHQAGLRQVETRPVDVPTHFKDFDDYWLPFLGGQGPAPGYLMSLSEERKIQLRERIRASLPFAPDGSIPLMARAWAVRGLK